MTSASQSDGGPTRGQEEGFLQFSKALSTLDEWAIVAAVGEARALEAGDERVQRALRQAQDVLALLRNTISAGSPPEYVFALGEEGGGILAIAAATHPDGRRGTGGGGMDIVVVARPTGAEQRAAVQELLGKVGKWAAAGGRRAAVSQLREAADYCAGLGVGPPGAEHDTVEGPVGRLAVFGPADFEPYRPASSLVREPYDVTTVVDEWAREAAALSAKAAKDGDEGTERVLRGTLDILGRIRGGVAAALPDYAFAITEGGGVDGIRAIATVSARNASGGPGGRRAVSIGELLAKPTAAGGDNWAEAAAELAMLTLDWAVATGHSVAEFICNMTHKGSASGGEEEDFGRWRSRYQRGIAEKLESAATPSPSTTAAPVAAAPSMPAQAAQSTTAAATATAAPEATTGATAAATTAATTSAAASTTAAATTAVATTAAATTAAATTAAATTAAATTAAPSTSRTAAWTATFRAPTTGTSATATTTTTAALATRTKLAGAIAAKETTTTTTTMRDGVQQGTPHHVVPAPLAGRFHLIALRLPSPPGERLAVPPAAFASIYE